MVLYLYICASISCNNSVLRHVDYGYVAEGIGLKYVHIIKTLKAVVLNLDTSSRVEC